MLVLLMYIAAILHYGVIGTAESTCKCVKPTSKQVRNPCTTDECLLLMEYAEFPANFSNDTIFKFLPGDHALSKRILIHYVHNLTLSGLNGDNGRPVVQCSGMTAGFWFKDIVDLQIDGLTFQNCGFQHSQNQSQAILMQEVTNLLVSDVQINNSSGFGLFIVNLKGNSTIHSTAISKSHNESGCFGGNLRMIFNNCTSDTHSVLISNSFLSNGYIQHRQNACPRHEAYASGLGVFLNTSNNISITVRNTTLAGNIARNGGNLAVKYVHMTDWTSSVVIDNCTIANGSALLGGGMYLVVVARQKNATNISSHFVDIITIKDTIFERNTADKVGAGFYAQLFEDVNLSSGAHIGISNTIFRLNTVPQFVSNGGGVAVSILTFNLASYMHHRMPQFNISLISCSICENTVQNLSGSEPVGSATLYIEQNSLTYFKDVEITNNNCTGIALVRSNIVLEGNSTLSGNVGNYGGGIVLCDNSILYLQRNVTLNILYNRALSYGGGIFAEFDCTQAIPPCFYQFDNQNSKNIIMENNHANKSGSEIFGGSIEYCYYFGHYDTQNNTEIFFHLFNFPGNTSNDPSYITSSPRRVCFCEVKGNESLRENCSVNDTVKKIYPGSTIKIPLVAVGQRHGPVPGVVVATNVTEGSSTVSIKNNSCTYLTYLLKPNVIACTDQGMGSVIVNIDVQDRDLGNKYNSGKTLTLNVFLKPCPLGFELQNASQCVCVCHRALQRLDKIECQISITTIYKHRYSQSWFGFLPQDNTSDLEIVSYPYCPFDYCNRTVTHAIKIIQPWTANDQCAYNRSGILCGGCNGSLSLVLGSSRCSDCSRKYSTLRVFGLVTAFGVAGLLVVVFFGITDATVAEGTLNAVIFYVNVVVMNRSIIFDNTPENNLLNFLSVFISWMNLDFGFEVCFYDGMTSFQKALLQFAFPLYLWFISGAIIFLCRKSVTMSKWFGKNSVKILATVILHSYAKLLRAVIGALFYTSLYHSSGYYSKMWSVDGNIHYLGQTHIILFVIAIMVGLITLPYTLALLFIQCLRRWSNMKLLFWVNKLKPFFDAYTGPYKDKYHFWTGFLLVVRIVLFLAIAVDNHSGWNTTLIIGVTSVLFVISRPGIYKNWALNIIEVLVYANLTILAILTDARLNNSKNLNTILCIGSMFLLFCGIVMYHILKKLSVTRRWGLMKVWLLDRKWPWMKRKQIRSLILPYVDPDNDEDLSSSDSELDPILHNAPPVVRYDQYREPLIGTIVN